MNLPSAQHPFLHQALFFLSINILGRKERRKEGKKEGREERMK
jgi:hypothetical protein